MKALGGQLDKLLRLAAADLTEPDVLGAAHEHLVRRCPWYAHVGGGGGDAPEKHCRPAPGRTVKLTPRTPEASTVPKPTRPPGGPGLFRIKGRELPPYLAGKDIQHLWYHLKSEYGPEKAYRVAVGVVEKWAKGIHPGGGKGKKGGRQGRVHPDVQAAAQKNVAQWEKDRADAHRQRREHEQGRGKKAAAAVKLARPAATAPGAEPVPGGQGQQYGLYQHPAQAVSPSPPLPPDVRLPSAAEVRKLAGQVPEGADASLSASARNHLDAAAGKLSRDDSLAALHMLRAAQSDIYSAHKKDLGAAGAAAMTAGVFARVPPAEQSSATAGMIRSREREMAWRRLELAVAACIDRIRRRHFHGMYGGSPLARFSGGQAESPLEKVVRLAGDRGRRC